MFCDSTTNCWFIFSRFHFSATVVGYPKDTSTTYNPTCIALADLYIDTPVPYIFCLVLAIKLISIDILGFITCTVPFCIFKIIVVKYLNIYGNIYKV